jgi:Dolichyl-phosphate-mannose-protein mannosyltransferase
MACSSSLLRGVSSKIRATLKNQTPSILFIGLALLSIALRVGLVWYNRQSNDNHMQVVQLMLASARLPQLKDCWECFQPKMFHFTVTEVLQVLGLTGLPINGLNLVAEIINFLAGLVTLAVAWVFISDLPVKQGWLKPLAFGLVALNPALIGINSQATNDTFAILFSTLAIYCTYIFLQRKRIIPFLLAILFTALGIASKTNVWVTAVVIGITLFIQACSKPGRTIRTAIHAVTFLVAVPLLSVINPLTQYVTNYATYDKPVLMNIGTLPLPPLTGVSKYNDRGGILSIQDGFFTFKFISLLQHPRIEYDHDNYPPNRTSFWTMLYGSANSASFSNYPPSWSTTGTQGFLLTRGIFILAILPVFLLLMGGLMETVNLIRGIFKRDFIVLQNTGYGLFALTFIGYIAFAILYALFYQTFLVLKAIFVFPALLAFPLLFLRAAEPAYAFLSKRVKWSIPMLNVAMIALIILYIIDIGMLITRIRLYH